jgi:hypothetical protein
VGHAGSGRTVKDANQCSSELSSAASRSSVQSRAPMTSCSRGRRARHARHAADRCPSDGCLRAKWSATAALRLRTTSIDVTDTVWSRPSRWRHIRCRLRSSSRGVNVMDGAGLDDTAAVRVESIRGVAASRIGGAVAGTVPAGPRCFGDPRPDQALSQDLTRAAISIPSPTAIPLLDTFAC